MAGDHVKKILFVIIFVALLLPLVNDRLHIITTEELHGSFTQSPDVTLTGEKWWAGDFQEQKNKYLNDNISFRPDLIRLNAQLHYSLFRAHTTGWGVFGKNNCMLDDKYIDAYTGRDYVGYDSIKLRLQKLKAVQDTFAHMGKSLVLVHPAHKAFYYADCIPDRYLKNGLHPTNYATCVRIGDSLGINQLDFNLWFRKMRDTSRELLYPKQGIHWSMYGAILAEDSLVKYLERLRNTTMPHTYVRSLEHTTRPRTPDNDISITMNLIWPITTETFTYAECGCDSSRAKSKPVGVYIGDSFTSMIRDGRLLDCVTSKWEIWFYMQERQYRVPGQLVQMQVPMGDYNWLAALDSADYVVLMYTAQNLNRLGDGFIEKAYDHYFPGKEAYQKR